MALVGAHQGDPSKAARTFAAGGCLFGFAAAWPGIEDPGMRIPANATEKPSIAKVWRQVKGNAGTFATIWGLISITSTIDSAFSRLLYQTAKHNGHHTFIAQFIAIIGSLPTTLLSTLAIILVTAVPAIYYTTDRCPEIFDIITRKPLRYALASFMFTISVVIGFLFFIIPGILVALMEPLYVYYVFTTDLDLTTCLSKAFKGMFQDFGSLFVVSLLSFLAVIISIVSIIFLIFIPSLLFLLSIIKIYSSASFLLSALLIFLSLAVLSIPMIVLSMRELYMQNYIHHKGLVRARELA
ncbi:MAG: hypothetical protein OXF67_02385 [Cyanobacteria bacterium MAG CAR4_bin_6]|nr:hypothetical protein [Cyanobacteria bacterium MAG CAR4_bin_6]